jgi:hypothetical protein
MTPSLDLDLLSVICKPCSLRCKASQSPSLSLILISVIERDEASVLIDHLTSFERSVNLAIHHENQLLSETSFDAIRHCNIPLYRFI